MIRSFADDETQALYLTGRSRRLPADIVKRAVRKLEYTDLATRVDDLRVPPENRLHALDGTAKASMRSPSTISGVSVSVSLTAMPSTS